MTTTPTTDAEIQEIWFKGKRVLRTIVQVGIPSFIGFAAVLPTVLGALGLPVNSKVYVTLVAFAAAITAIAGALTRLMAVPAVNAFLVTFGLGSVPASAVTGDHTADATTTTVDSSLDTDKQTDQPL